MEDIVETINVQYNGTEMLYRLQTALLGMCNFIFMISLYLSSQTTKEQTCLIMQITSVGIILHFYTQFIYNFSDNTSTDRSSSQNAPLDM